MPTLGALPNTIPLPTQLRLILSRPLKTFRVEEAAGWEHKHGGGQSLAVAKIRGLPNDIKGMIKSIIAVCLLAPLQVLTHSYQCSHWVLP